MSINSRFGMVVARFSQLSRRDQLALVILTIFVSGWLIYTLLWQPLARANASLRSANATAAATLANVIDLAEQYRTLQATGGAVQRSATEESLTQVVDRSVAAHELAMSRFQPGSQGDVQVRFERAPFDRILRWLHQLETEHRVGVRELSITPAQGSGLVNVTARLYRP